VAVNDVAKPIGDLVHDVVAGDLLVRSVRTAPQAVQQPIGVRVDLGKGPTLRAGIALEQRSVAVAVHLHRPPVLDRHDDRAHGCAQPTGTGLGDGHATSQLAGCES
jgi:hypothetical protein